MYTYPTVRSLPRRPVDVVAELLHTDDIGTALNAELYRERAARIAEQDATRRIIVGKPCK